MWSTKEECPIKFLVIHFAKSGSNICVDIKIFQTFLNFAKIQNNPNQNYLYFVDTVEMMKRINETPAIDCLKHGSLNIVTYEIAS